MLKIKKNIKLDRLFKKLGFGLVIASSAISFSAYSVPYYWVDWQTWNPAGGTASGVITPSSGPDVNVSFAALTSTGGAGSFLGVTGSGLWTPASTYQSTQVDNAPNFEGLQLEGTPNMTYQVTLSEPIKDPLMAVSTLGSTGDSATYVFDSPFTILSQGVSCCWGNGTLVQLPGNVLQGNEGSGVIQFLGNYSTFSWTVPDPEYWHGFTFGIRTTEALEPTPPTVSPVPEPETYAMLLTGLGLLGFMARRRNDLTV